MRKFQPECGAIEGVAFEPASRGRSGGEFQISECGAAALEYVFAHTEPTSIGRAARPMSAHIERPVAALSARCYFMSRGIR